MSDAELLFVHIRSAPPSMKRHSVFDQSTPHKHSLDEFISIIQHNYLIGRLTSIHDSWSLKIELELSVNNDRVPQQEKAREKKLKKELKFNSVQAID